MAVLKKDSTITMRMNEVVITRIDGAKAITVTNKKSWIKRSVAVGPPSPKSSENACPNTGSENISSANMVTQIKIIRITNLF